MLKLLVVEDHALVREGLVQVLRQLEADVTVLEAADCHMATELLQDTGPVDLMLLDLGLPGLDGLSYLATLRKRYPGMRVVVLSGFDDPATVNKAMKSGAAGFVPKSFSSGRLLNALRVVISGGVVVPEALGVQKVAVPRAVSQGWVDPEKVGLTARQIEVLRLMARGKSNRDIANLLGLSEGTVKIHLSAVFRALGVNSRAQAIVAISRKGIAL